MFVSVCILLSGRDGLKGYRALAQRAWGLSLAGRIGRLGVALQMKGKIMRKDFHIMYDEKVSIGPAVGEEVMIEVRTEGIKKVDNSKM